MPILWDLFTMCTENWKLNRLPPSSIMMKSTHVIKEWTPIQRKLTVKWKCWRMAWAPKIRGENSTTGEDNGIRNQAVGGQTKIATGIPAKSWKQKPAERSTCKSSQTSQISNHEVWWIIHGLAKPLTIPACYRWQNSRIYGSFWVTEWEKQ